MLKCIFCTKESLILAKIYLSDRTEPILIKQDIKTSARLI